MSGGTITCEGRLGTEITGPPVDVEENAPVNQNSSNTNYHSLVILFLKIHLKTQLSLNTRGQWATMPSESTDPALFRGFLPSLIL